MRSILVCGAMRSLSKTSVLSGVTAFLCSLLRECVSRPRESWNWEQSPPLSLFLSLSVVHRLPPSLSPAPVAASASPIALAVGARSLLRGWCRCWVPVVPVPVVFPDHAIPSPHTCCWPVRRMIPKRIERGPGDGYGPFGSQDPKKGKEPSVFSKRKD